MRAEATAPDKARCCDWRVAAFFIAGGILGGVIGVKSSVGLAERRRVLSKGFAVMVVGVAAFVLWRSPPGLMS